MAKEKDVIEGAVAEQVMSQETTPEQKVKLINDAINNEVAFMQTAVNRTIQTSVQNILNIVTNAYTPQQG